MAPRGRVPWVLCLLRDVRLRGSAYERILRQEDRLARLLERVKDFHRMGVGQVWVFDSETQRVWVSTAEGVTEWSGGLLRVARTRIELDPAVAFARMMRRR